MSTLILAEHANGELSPAIASLVSAATAMDAPVTILVAGENVQDLAQRAATIAGADKVLVADDPAFGDHLAEPLAALIAEIAKDYRTIVSTTSTTAKDIMPRAAALCDAPQISDVVAVESPDTVLRSAYAGNALERVRTQAELTFFTVRASSFLPAGDGNAVAIEALSFVPQSAKARMVSRQHSQSERPDLGAAKIVVSGGRAFGSKERFDEVLLPLAEKLNAAVGASRAAVDAGYVSNDLQVGQTGRIVAPDLYIACGISGAVQHMAGMKGSKVIVAINSDADAPIFEYADYGLVADIFSAVPELTSKL